MIRSAFLFLIAVLTVSFAAHATDAYRRVVNFEWEPIEGAKFYEIEIRKKASGSKTSSFKTEKAEWTGKLQVGRYEFRLRSLDQRKVPGDWSAFSELDVLLEPAKIKSPAPDSQIKASDVEKHEVNFEWQPTPGATGYLFEVYNDKNEKIAEEKLSSPKVSEKLPAASQYTWKVKAISNEGLESEASEVHKFTLVGPKLAKTQIEKPDSEYVREVKWSPVEKAENYDVVVGHYNPQLKKWQKFKEYQNYDKTSLNFESDWPGGQYKLLVKAKASIRESSDLTSLNFPVREGNRSPATEYVQTMRKSIDRVDGWFGYASWYGSSINLESRYRNILAIETKAFTGTGRMGIGLIRSESPWGFIAILDAGGYIFENKIYNFFGLEASAVKRQNTSDRGELRYLMGLFTKDFPSIWTTSSSTLSNINNTNNVQRVYSKGSVLGPHGGVEYWYSLTPKFGLQGNAHVYIPAMGLELPNGGKLKPGDVNFSIGALGSYRYSSRLTGLVGINYRSETYTYTDNSDPSGWSSAVFQGKVNNTVHTSISGVYVNLMAEYSF